jgi:hypothetical protein
MWLGLLVVVVFCFLLQDLLLGASCMFVFMFASGCVVLCFFLCWICCFVKFLVSLGCLFFILVFNVTAYGWASGTVIGVER